MRLINSLARNTVLLLLATLGLAEDCTGPFQDVRGFPKDDIRGNGTGRCETKWSKGLVVTGVDVWANPWHVKAIQFTYSDGSVGDVIGKPEGERRGSITWEKDKPIEEFVLWGNYEADSLGRIKIVVGDKTLNEGCDVGGSAGNTIEKRTGILLGAAVSAGDKVDNFWPMMLSDKIGTVTITDVVLAEDLNSWNQQRKGINTIDFKGAVANNPSAIGTPPQTFSMKKSITRISSTTNTWHQQNAIAITSKTEFKGQVKMPLYGKVEGTDSFEGKYERTWFDEGSGTDASTETFEWTQGGQVPPQRSVSCSITSLRGKFGSDYTAKLNLTLTEPDVSFEISMQGTWESIGWARFVSECKEGPLLDSTQVAGAEFFDLTQARPAVEGGVFMENNAVILNLEPFTEGKTSRRWDA